MTASGTHSSFVVCLELEHSLPFTLRCTALGRSHVGIPWTEGRASQMPVAEGQAEMNSSAEPSRTSAPVYS